MEREVKIKGLSSFISFIGVLFVVVILIFVIFKPFQTIETGYVGIKSILGKYNMEELLPGLHLKIPVVETITPFDVRVRSITYKSQPEEKVGALMQRAIEVLDERGMTIDVELTVQYRPIPKMAAEILANWGPDWEMKLLNPTIRSIVRDIIGKIPAEEIPSKRAAINSLIENGIRKKLEKELLIDGKTAINVVAVQLRNIKLPPQVEKKILEVQEAKQEAERTKYLVEKALNEQKAEKIKADTLRIKKVTEAKADAEAILERAKAEAEANRILSNSITENLIKWKRLEVQEKLYRAIKENPNTTIFMGVQPGGFHLWEEVPKKGRR